MNAPVRDDIHLGPCYGVHNPTVRSCPREPRWFLWADDGTTPLAIACDRHLHNACRDFTPGTEALPKGVAVVVVPFDD